MLGPSASPARANLPGRPAPLTVRRAALLAGTVSQLLTDDEVADPTGATCPTGSAPTATSRPSPRRTSSADFAARAGLRQPGRGRGRGAEPPPRHRHPLEHRHAGAQSTHSEGGLTAADFDLAATSRSSDSARARSCRQLRRARPQRVRPSANASGGGQVQTRFRSPKPPSIRPTGGQYLSAPVAYSGPACSPAGKAASRREYGWVHSSAVTWAWVCGALTSGLSSAGHSPASTLAISLADGDHRLAEPVQLGQVLRLGRLDHQRAGHREAHRRGVEAVVDQPLGHVVHGDPAGLGQRPQVEDALVGDPAAAAGVEHRVVPRPAAWPRSWPPAARARWPRSARRRPSSRCRRS